MAHSGTADRAELPAESWRSPLSVAYRGARSVSSRRYFGRAWKPEPVRRRNGKAIARDPAAVELVGRSSTSEWEAVTRTVVAVMVAAETAGSLWSWRS